MECLSRNNKFEKVWIRSLKGDLLLSEINNGNEIKPSGEYNVFKMKTVMALHEKQVLSSDTFHTWFTICSFPNHLLFIHCTDLFHIVGIQTTSVTIKSILESTIIAESLL